MTVVTYPLSIIRPTALAAGSAKITASNMTELDGTYDPVEWTSAPSAIGAQRARASLHQIYQPRTAGALSTAPENDPTNWALVGVTNKWKPFDDSYQSQASRADSISYT